MKKLLALALVLVLILALIPAAHADLADTLLSVWIKQVNETGGDAGTYSYVRHGNLIVLKFVGGYADDLYEAAKTDEDFKAIWDGIAEAVAEESKQLQEGLDPYSVIVIDCIVSAKDESVVLMAASCGEIIIDLLNGISIFAE